MAEWSRETLWRQGLFLEDKSIDKHSLRSEEFPEKTVVIMASHDCDLPQPPSIEPYFEVIVGRYIDHLDGACTFTKSPRKLHIEIQTLEGQKFVEFIAKDKHRIDKSYLPEIIPNLNLQLDVDGLREFKRWLSVRYSRSSFANTFETRLKSHKLDRGIAKILQKHGELITGIFFEVDESQEIKHISPEDTYLLDITILYSTNSDPGAAEVAAQEASDAIIKLFKTKLFDSINRAWKEIELRFCDVISDEALTYKQSTQLKLWRLDYISLSEDPPHPIIE